jgi:hypothetical protein
LYIKDAGSRNGAIIVRDGKQTQLTTSGAFDYQSGQLILPPGTPFYLRSTDEIWLGAEPWNGGERLSLSILEAPKPADYYRVSQPAPPAARVQSNTFARMQELVKPLEDGFHLSGQFRELDADGDPKWGSMPITVVDKTELTPMIADIKSRFGHLPAPERATMIAHYVREKLTPAGMTAEKLNDLYVAFIDANEGDRVTLGRCLQDGHGACTQQALLFKVIGDEVGLNVKLIRGNGTDGGININHAWTTVDFGDGPRVFDPRQCIYNVPAQNLPSHRPGSGIAVAHVQPKPLLRQGDQINYQGKDTWVVEGFDGATGDVRIRHFGTRPISREELPDFHGLNRTKLTADGSLVIGEEYLIRRSSGAIESWRLNAVNQDGSLRMSSDSAFREVLPKAALTGVGLELEGLSDWLVRTGESPDMARERMLRILKQERDTVDTINHKDKPRTGDVERQMEEQLEKLKASGEICRDWRIFPTAKDSAAHKVGWDYLLVNTRTGAMHSLDITTDQSKLATPKAKNVAIIRRDGVIYYENCWFDAMGKPRRDDADELIAEAAQAFPLELAERFRLLSSQDTPFVLGEAPFPDFRITDLPKQKQQVQNFIDWMRKRAKASADSVQHKQLDEYADILESKVLEHLKIATRPANPAVFKKLVNEAAQRTLLDVLIGKVTNMKPVLPKPPENTADVYVNKDLHISLKSSDGSHLDAGHIAEALENGRLHILNAQNLRELVKEKNIPKWIEKSNSTSENDLWQKIRRAAVTARNEIRALSSSQSPDPGNLYILRLLERLQQNSEDALTGRPTQQLATAGRQNAQKIAHETLIDATARHPRVYDGIKKYWQALGGELTGGEPLPGMIYTLEMLLSDHLKVWDQPSIQHLKELYEKYKTGDQTTVETLHAMLR